MKKKDEKNLLFDLEKLENRQMLSSVQVFATGDMGDEAFKLQVRGETVLEVSDIQGGGVFSVNVDEHVTADDVRIEFTNDAWDPANGVDRNLIVDKIVIDGRTFQTEDASTLSTGTWNGNGFSPGFYQSETLHGSGYFQFSGGGGNSADSGRLIEVRARGDEGGENMEVIVNGQVVGSFDVSTRWQTYTLRTELYQPGDDVTVRFTNDIYDPANGIDRNLIVDKVIADGVICETEDPSTFGFGTWKPGVGFTEDFHQSETLHTNGYFNYKFDTPVPNDASLGDKVWFDLDRDGRHDGNEGGVQGVRVTLTGGGNDGVIGTGDDTTNSMRTDSNGMYRFDSLTPGVEYKVSFSDLPEGFEFTRPNATNDSLDSDADPITGMTQVVTLGPGEYNPTLDAGLVEDCVHLNIPGLDAERDLDGNTQVPGWSNFTGVGLDIEGIAFDVSDLPSALGAQTITSIDASELGSQLIAMGASDFILDGDTTGRTVDFQLLVASRQGSGFLAGGLNEIPREFTFTVHYRDASGQTREVDICITPDGFKNVSPIALDLNGDGQIGVTGEHTAQGAARSALGRTVQFDMDANGSLDTVEWFAGDGDGILVDTAKIGANGEIDGSALFGDQGGKFEHGYQKLAQLDSNNDGSLNGGELNALALWLDDGDAKLEEGELQSLSDQGVDSIATQMKLDSEGRMRSEAQLADGSSIMTEDVWFAVV